MEKKKSVSMFNGAWPQLFAVLSCTVSAVADGMQYGWSAPIIPMLKEPGSPVQISETDESWLETIYMYGGIAGLLCTSYLVDKIGRKYSILTAAAVNLSGWIMISMATTVELLYVARFLTGLSGDVMCVAAPMYIAEIASKEVRGFLSGLIYIMMLVGILIIYSVAPFVPIYASSIVGACMLVVQLVTFPFLPESPYYLLMKNKPEKAREALMRLRTDSTDIEEELNEIKDAVQRQLTEKGRPQDLILVKSNRKALIIITVLDAAQHFSSISVMLMNIHTLLESADSVYVNATTASIIFSAVMLISATVSDFFVDKFGRKILLTSSSLLTGLSLLLLAVYFTLQRTGYDVSGISWIPITAVMFYAAVFKYGLGMVPVVLTAELFPAKVKALGMTLSDAAYLVFGLISIEMYQRLGLAYGLDIPFYIFSASCLLTTVFSMFYIPETKGKTLDEIQFILKGEPIKPDIQNVKA